MSRIELLTDFSERAKAAIRLDDLVVLVDGVAGELGFDYYAFGHHVDLRLPPAEAIQVVRYPTAWFETVLERRFYVDDPVLTAAQRRAAGFRWDELPRLLPLSERQKSILEQAPREGLGAGYTIPVHVPGEYSGSAHFAVRARRDLPEASLPAAHFVGVAAFEAARRIQLARFGPRDAPPLSPRHRDCIALVAQGLSDKAIARRLGIQPDTAHGYVEEAMRRYGATKRSQLVVRALFEGDIAFADALSLPPE